MRYARQTSSFRSFLLLLALALLGQAASPVHAASPGQVAGGQATGSPQADTQPANARLADVQLNATQPVDTTVPNTTVPNTTVPNTTVPNTTVPNTALSNTDLSDAMSVRAAGHAAGRTSGPAAGRTSGPAAGRAAGPALDRVGAEEAPKSPGRATALSLGGTLLLAPAYGAGLFVGPAFGHFCAENHSQAWQGIALRGGAALAALATAESAGSGGEGPDGDFDGLGEALAWLAVGAGAVIGSGIYDIATAGDAAREHNRKEATASGGVTSARVTPTVGGPEGEQVGLSVKLEL